MGNQLYSDRMAGRIWEVRSSSFFHHIQLGCMPMSTTSNSIYPYIIVPYECLLRQNHPVVKKAIAKRLLMSPE